MTAIIDTDNPRSPRSIATAVFVAVALWLVMMAAGCGTSHAIEPVEFSKAMNVIDDAGLAKIEARIANLTANQIPEPPELRVEFIPDKFSDTTLEDVDIEILGKPRLHQFFNDRSMGWAVRCKITAKERTKPLAGVMEIQRDEKGFATTCRERNTQFRVKADHGWVFVNAYSVRGPYSSSSAAWHINGGDPDEHWELHVLPNTDRLNIKRQTTNGDEYFMDCRDTNQIEVDLYFHKGMPK